MALHPNVKKSTGIAWSLLLLLFFTRHSDNKAVSVVSFVGGGSMLLGGWKVVVEAVDFLDQLADELYWNRRKTS